jgi:3-hydroxyacyl-[acyl-carrier-protein] dehydratase
MSSSIRTERRRAMPIVAIDSVDVVSDTVATSRKSIRADDAYLNGHYPQFTIYPGIFIIESIGQTVDEFLARTTGEWACAHLKHIESVRFISPLLPGDTLELSCVIDRDGAELAVRAKAADGAGRSVAQAKLRYEIHGWDEDA